MGMLGIGRAETMNQEAQTTGAASDGVEDLDQLVDEWGDGSFPASDPPGALPPGLTSKAQSIQVPGNA